MRAPVTTVAVFLVAACALAVSDAVLVLQNRKIRALGSACVASEQSYVGEVLPPVSGRTIAGSVSPAGYSVHGRKTLVLAFDARCGECVVNARSWRRILSALDRERVRVIGVSLDGAGLSKKSLSEVGLGNADAVVDPDGETVLQYRLRLTPQTILVGPGGAVEGVWTGVLSRAEVNQVLGLVAQTGVHVH